MGEGDHSYQRANHGEGPALHFGGASKWDMKEAQLSRTKVAEAMVKLDFKNAFNSLNRDRMVLALEDIAPELTPYCRLAYAEATVVQFGKFTLLSQVGPQQGNPLGPLLFCLPVQPILQSLSFALTLGYLDDISLGGSTALVAEDVKRIECGCGLMGLQFDREKCEIITHSGDWMEHLPLQQFIPLVQEKACLLGASLSPEEALETCLEFRCSKLALAVKRLENIANHDALVLLRKALCSQKILHALEMLSML